MCGIYTDYTQQRIEVWHSWSWGGDVNNIPPNYKCECGLVEYKDKDKTGIER